MMKQKYPWIETEKQFFGRRHTDYDFQAKQPAKEQQALKALESEQLVLAKKINKKVLPSIDVWAYLCMGVCTCAFMLVYMCCSRFKIYMWPCQAYFQSPIRHSAYVSI